MKPSHSRSNFFLLIKHFIFQVFREIINIFRYLYVILMLFVDLILSFKDVINLYSISKNINTEYSMQKSERNFIYSEYHTSTLMFPTWIDKLFSRIKLPSLLLSILICIIVYLIGLLVSLFVGFQSNYLNSVPIYFGLLGISITIFIIRYGSTSIHKSYDQLRPCFVISDFQYKNFLENWFSRLSNIRSTIYLCVILSLFFIALSYFSFYYSNLLEYYKIVSIKPRLFEIQNWYNDPYKFVKFILLAFYSICIAFPLATAGRILFINFFFLLDLHYLPIIPIPNLVRNRLRGITDLYMVITFFWFLGAILFIALFYGSSDILSTSIIFMISILGFLTFITPQVMYHFLLKKSEETASKWILASFYKKMNIILIEESDKKIMSTQEAASKYDLATLVDYFDASIPTKRWVYSQTEVLLFVIGQIFTFIVSNYQSEFHNLLMLLK
jgi:hypothetical protein